MKSFNLSIVIALAFWLIPGAFGQTNVRTSLQPTTDRKLAPALSLRDSSGKVLNLRAYRGKIVLLDFWATWCHGCKEEMPWFADFQRTYGTKGLIVIGVSLDDDGWKVVKPFIKSAGVPYRIVLGNSVIAKKYGIKSMPDTFLIDRRGHVAAKYVGLVDQQNLEANLQQMLAE